MLNRGGTHEQHVKAGQQSHKNDDRTHHAGERDSDRRESGGHGERGGSHEQHVRVGQQSHKNDR